MPEVEEVVSPLQFLIMAIIGNQEITKYSYLFLLKKFTEALICFDVGVAAIANEAKM